jgi:hypothetical protein
MTEVKIADKTYDVDRVQGNTVWFTDGTYLLTYPQRARKVQEALEAPDLVADIVKTVKRTVRRRRKKASK